MFRPLQIPAFVCAASVAQAELLVCTDYSAFTVAGDTDCKARGFDRSEFRQIEVDTSKSFTLNLTAGSNAPAPTVHSDPPGAQGEPYSTSGILSHCDVFDASMACEIHADGFRYIAFSTGPTPQSLLEDLMAKGKNRPISVSGDMMFYEVNVAEVTIRGYDITARDPYAGYRATTQWLGRSMDDPKYEVLMYGGFFEECINRCPRISRPCSLPKAAQAHRARVRRSNWWLMGPPKRTAACTS